MKVFDTLKDRAGEFVGHLRKAARKLSRSHG